MMNFFLALLGILMTSAIEAKGAASITHLRLPPGFTVDLYADKVPNARSLTLGDDNTVYVGTRKAGKVYALRDTDADGKADEKFVIAKGLTMPNGVAFYHGDLYVAEVARVLKFQGIGKQLRNPPSPKVVFDNLPTDLWHGWKYLRFGPDGKLYTAVGAPCNVCLPKQEIYSTIVRMNPDGSGFEIYARGVRNSVGFDWHPQTRTLWFTDNGRDWLGDDLPPDELNHAPKPGMHFGFPFCHGGDIPDPQYGREEDCKDYVPPAWRFGAHVAPLGLRFYTGSQFPADYRGKLFVAQHGSWNRTQPTGYRVVALTIKNGQVVDQSDFVTGWLQSGEKVIGRPVDLLQMPDGSLLVSDDHRGAIYRIVYHKINQPK